eukprot:7045782-Pyramimonas_sp.AAC.2
MIRARSYMVRGGPGGLHGGGGAAEGPREPGAGHAAGGGPGHHRGHQGGGRSRGGGKHVMGA